MPNWCENYLQVNGELKDLESFKQEVKGEEEWIDFNKIISNEETKIESKKTWNTMTEEEKKRWFMFEKDEQAAFNSYWFNNVGYNWQIDNWGTKWQSNISEPETQGDALMYVFDSAWSPPIPIIQSLIKKYPKLRFYFEYEEPGCCFAGELTGENGEILIDEYWKTESEECPECEQWNTKKKGEEFFECSECGNEYKEVVKNEKENV
jgi:hypothetical protein